MDDRFKFRVWAKPFDKYLQLDDGSLFTQSDGTLWINIGDYSGDELIEKCLMDYTIEQCTGLPDKNGVLIYEGDVVIDDGEIFTVEWANGAWMLVEPLGCDELFYFIESKGLEIISNIHEHKHLLEKDNA